LLITAQGYSARDRIAEAIAAARHLLETVYRRPVIVRPMRVAKTRAESQKLLTARAAKRPRRTQRNSGREARS
jgi:hypothetical protein